MSVTDLTRKLNRNKANLAFRNVCPDLMRTLTILPGEFQHRLSSHPQTAGKTFHRLLKKAPSTSQEMAYLPWLIELRKVIWGIGVWKSEAEVRLDPIDDMPGGDCDLLVHGGPRKFGIIEIKVLMHGSQKTPRGGDLAQLGAYTRLAAGRGSFDNYWAGLAYIELGTGLVRLNVYENTRRLISQTISVFRGAQDFSEPENTLQFVHRLPCQYGYGIAI